MNKAETEVLSWLAENVRWIDRKALVIEPYRAAIFERAFAVDEEGRLAYSMVLTGRGKKNWKSADLVLAALYRLMTCDDPQGSDCAILANDEGQAGDDLSLAKKIVQASPRLNAKLRILAKAIERMDGKGSLLILPAGDVAGLHGKSFCFIGYDEIHGYRDYAVLEALAPDPTRDVLTWIASYATVYNRPGVPLFDLCKRGRDGTDDRMLFSWYSADYTTDPAIPETATAEERANPSMSSWLNRGYLAVQKLRLPSHKYRRLHLNLPGSPEGAYFEPSMIEGATVSGLTVLAPVKGLALKRRYVAFVDMSGGSSDDSVLAIAHEDRTAVGPQGFPLVLDLVVSQSGKAPFNPRDAVKKFAGILQGYGIAYVYGDDYAGQTFKRDFAEHGIFFRSSPWRSAHEIYEAAEPLLTSGRVRLLDVAKLTEQTLGLVMKSKVLGHPRITHPSGEHDDFPNAAFGALLLAAKDRRPSITFAPEIEAEEPGFLASAVEAVRALWPSGGDVTLGGDRDFRAWRQPVPMSDEAKRLRDERSTTFPRIPPGASDAEVDRILKEHGMPPLDRSRCAEYGNDEGGDWLSDLWSKVRR